MDVEPLALSFEDEAGKPNNSFDVLPLDEGKSQSAALEPNAPPFVPATPAAPSKAAASQAVVITQDLVPPVPAFPPASPVVAASTADASAIGNAEYRLLKSGAKKLYKKLGKGPAESSSYVLKKA